VADDDPEAWMPRGGGYVPAAGDWFDGEDRYIEPRESPDWYAETRTAPVPPPPPLPTPDVDPTSLRFSLLELDGPVTKPMKPPGAVAPALPVVSAVIAPVEAAPVEATPVEATPVEATPVEAVAAEAEEEAPVRESLASLRLRFNQYTQRGLRRHVSWDVLVRRFVDREVKRPLETCPREVVPLLATMRRERAARRTEQRRRMSRRTSKE